MNFHGNHVCLGVCLAVKAGAMTFLTNDALLSRISNYVAIAAGCASLLWTVYQFWKERKQ